MKLLILKLKEIIFEGDIKYINLPGYNGYFHVLNNHGKLFSILVSGNIKFKVIKYIKGNYYTKYNNININSEQILKIKSGLVQIKKNNIKVLLD